jgi:bilirubin oxidase
MQGLTRRRVLQVCGAAGMTMVVPMQFPSSAGAAAVRRAQAGLLEPAAIPKYVTPLVIPPVMPPTTRGAVDYYEIAVRQFRQQILPAGLPATTVWSYGSINHPGTFNYPAFTIEAAYRRPVRVRWINGLVDAQGNYLPHLLPVDPTLHWANPPGGTAGRDSRPVFDTTPSRYDGPVPIITHVHGAHMRTTATASPRPGISPTRRTFRPAMRGRARSTTTSRRNHRTARVGARVTPCSSTRTISALPRCGTTTTPSA